MSIHLSVVPRDEQQSQAQRLSSPSSSTLSPSDRIPIPVRSVEALKPKLLDQVRESMRTRHYSLRTEKTYVQWIKRFIFFHDKRHPNEMAEAEITAFLTHLARAGKVAASTQNQHVKASLTCQERLQETAACSKCTYSARKQTQVFTSATRITFAFG